MKKLNILLLSIFAFLIFTTSIQAAFHRVTSHADPGDFYGNADSYSESVGPNVAVSASAQSWSLGDAVAKAYFKVNGNTVITCISWYGAGTVRESYSYKSSQSSSFNGYTFCYAGNGMSLAFVDISWN